MASQDRYGANVPAVPAYRSGGTGVSMGAPSPYGGGGADPYSVYDIPPELADAPVIIRRLPAGSRGPAVNFMGLPISLPATEETVPLGQALEGFYTLGRDRVAELQQKLHDGGFYGKGYKINSGVADEETYAAYGRALIRATRSSKSLDEVLAESVLGGPVGGSGSAADKAPLSILLTNPDDLKAVASSAASKLIGRKLNDDELGRFVEAYHVLEGAAQRERYGVQTGEPNTEGTTVAAPDPSSYASQRLPEEHPQEAASYGMVGRYMQFQQLLNSTGGK